MKLLLLITDQHSEVGVEACAHFDVGHANRGLRSSDVNTVGGKRGLFSCDSLLVWFAEFTHPGSMKLIT